MYPKVQSWDHLYQGISKHSMFDWSSENILKDDSHKCHLIAGSRVLVNIQISDVKVTSESRIKLLGIYVGHICKKASKKLHALARICNYVEISKSRVNKNYFIKSQFSYYHLIWMFYSRRMERRINKIHEKTFRFIYPSDLKS